jgi:hypothetical protein
MQDQPSTAELVGAVEDFLRNVAMKHLEGHAQFHARVSANALAIVKRELELGPGQAEDELARLRGLLGQDGDLDALNRELCRRMREGEIALEDDAHLWATTLEKVAIDQPRYSGYQRALEEQKGRPAG